MFFQLLLTLFLSILIRPITAADKTYKYRGIREEYKIPEKKWYEIVAAGAAGGRELKTDGGRGGISAGIMEFEVDDILYIFVGGRGEDAKEDCGGTGGGGASIVIKAPEGIRSEILLIGSGGGGAGLATKPYEPDNEDLTKNIIGICEDCNNTDKTCYSAAPGKNIDTFRISQNFTYNPSKTDNYTRGCFGGFGGGGQGGAQRESSNRSTTGGGGGGGGWPGGEVGTDKNAKSCSAGGPGKAECKMKYCNVTRVNESRDGYVIIRIHELYKELPTRDRTNRESPVRTIVPGGTGSKVNFKFSGQILILLTLLMFD